MNDWGTGFAALRTGDPVVAWLVHRAELVSSSLAHEQALSFWAAGYLKTQTSPG
jgi:hypothetical protein